MYRIPCGSAYVCYKAHSHVNFFCFFLFLSFVHSFGGLNFKSTMAVHFSVICYLLIVLWHPKYGYLPSIMYAFTVQMKYIIFAPEKITTKFFNKLNNHAYKQGKIGSDASIDKEKRTCKNKRKIEHIYYTMVWCFGMA